MFRIDLDGPVIIRNRLPVVAEFAVGDTPVIIGLSIFRIDLDGPVIILKSPA